MGLIDGAVDGFFKGKDWREGVEDRKRRRKIEDEQLSWDREDQQWKREDRSYTVSERDRTKKRRDEEEQFWKDLATGDGTDAAPADSAAPPPETDAAPTQDAAAKPTSRRISLDQGAPATPSEPSTAPPQQSPAAAPATPAVVGVATHPSERRITLPDQGQPAPQGPSGRQQLSDLFTSQITGPAQAGGAQGAPVLAPNAAQFAAPEQSWPAPQNPQGQTVPPRPIDPHPSMDAVSARQQVIAQKQWDRDFSVNYMPDGSPKNGQNQPTIDTRSPGQPPVPGMAEAAIDMPGSGRARSPLPPAPMPGGQEGLANDPRLDANTRMAAAKAAQEDTATQAAHRRIVLADGNAQGGNYSANQPAPLAAPQTTEGTPAPSVAKAAETVPEPAKGRSIIGDGMPVKTTDAQAKKAADKFVDGYHKTEAQKVRDFYLSRGEPEKAKLYSQWIKDENVSEAMGYWAEAVHAATIGDDDRFVTSIARAYNAKGYYDDGYSIVPDASGIHRDEAGAITGAQITFKNDKTGQVFTQNLDSSEDLYRLGVNMLSPEQVFEHGYSRVQAADGLRDAVSAKLAEKALLGGSLTPDAVLDTMKKMSAANAEFSFLSLDEQVAQALKFMQGGYGAPGGGAATDIPIAARPQG